MTFADGGKTIVEGKWSIEIHELPILYNVLFINGLKANLLIISKFCDNNLSVQFSKDECNIYNQAGEWILKGPRTLDNCYGVSPTSRLSCHRVYLMKLSCGINFLGILTLEIY